jgi:hypothetical protein
LNELSSNLVVHRAATPPVEHQFRIKSAIFLVGIAFTGFLLVNLLTAERSPVVWQDEVTLADPAVNLSQGNGFTSTAWWQTGDRFFAGNAPLYSMLLYPWISLFGVHVTAVRSLNYVLILGVISVLWFAVRNLNLVQTARARLLFAALVLCGSGVTFSYRSGRYDCLGMLIISGIFAALAIKRRDVRFAVEVLLAALIPWAGLQLIPYVAMMSLVLLALRGRDAIRDVAAVVVGGILGSLTLAGFFMVHGVWGDFLRTSTIMAGARLSFAERLGRAAVAPLVDPSAMVLLVALVIVATASIIRRDGWRSGAVVGAILGIALPCAMGFVGRYPCYYSWMAFIPMAAALASAFEKPRPGRLVYGAALGLALLACGIGLPARLVVVWVEWDLRDAGKVHKFVTSHLRPTDQVFSIYEGYYAAKASAAGVILPPYIGESFAPDAPPGAITQDERERINVLILKPDCVESSLRFFGGEWQEVAHYKVDQTDRMALLERLKFGSKPYDIIIYRRPSSELSTVREGGVVQASGDNFAHLGFFRVSR